MKLTVLGSGICIIKKDRKGPAFLVEADEQLFLFDCGWGFGENFLKAGYKLQNLDHIIISHPHADHMGGLMNILQSIFVDGMFSPKNKREKPLHLHGYQGFAKDYEQLRSIFFPERIEPYESKIFEYHNNKNTFGNIKLTGKEVKHNPKYFHSSAYRLEHNNKVFMYTGDTSYDENLFELAQNADLALFEASNFTRNYKEHGPMPNHLSPYEVGELAQRAGVKMLGLVHVYYDLTNEDEMREEVVKNFTGELFFPYDLQIYKV